MHKRRIAWLSRVYRRSHSDHSRHSAEMALRAFDKKLGEPAESFIERIKNREIDVYSVFENFTARLDEGGYSPHTISDYVNRVKQYFLYNSVALNRETFRVKVGLPRIEDPDDRAPTVDELRKILSWGKLRTKTLILVLVSSGMRIGETIKLKVGDLDLSSQPVKISLSSRVASKTGKGRVTYISDEAADYLKQYLAERMDEHEAWVFISEADSSRHVSDDRAWKTIVDCVDKAGLGKLKETTVRGRRKIHPHSLRKFFFSKVVGIIGETAAHALMGHGSYMKTYYRRTERERKRDYLKCMAYLSVFAENPDKKKLKEEAALQAIRLFAQTFEIDPMRIKIERRKTLGREPTTDEEIKAIQNEIKKQRSGSNDPKKIIPEEKLSEHLAEGWDIQTVLPSGKIVVKRDF